MPTLLLLMAISLFGAGTSLGQQPPPAERLDRTRLLTYRDEAGRIQPVRGLQDWERRRAEIIAGMEAVMGPLPGPEKRGDLAVESIEEVDAGSYVRRLITYAAEPGGRVPAYLLIPKSVLSGDRQAPAALCLMPTNDEVGHRLVVGLAGPGALPNRNYGEELAERGYVVLAPAYPLLANYQPNLKQLGYASGTMKAIWDNIRGLDLLQSMPGVRGDALVAVGHSLGGHNAIYTAAFDTRIQAVVSSCGFDSYLDYMNAEAWAPGKGWVQERYMPRLAQYQGRLEEIPFDFHELVGALAPRGCFISAPVGDSNFKWESVDRVVASARPVYRLHQAEDRLRVEHPACDHDFPPEIRSEAYAWLDRLLADLPRP